MQKLKTSQGFSMSEMLAAVLIIALTFSFIGGGITVVKDAYQNITLRAEAQTLLSTTASAVSSELRNARDIGETSFYSTQRECRIHLENKNDNIYIVTEAASEEVPLLTGKTITGGLVPKIENLRYENGIFTYQIKIYHQSKVYEEQEISVRPMNAE